MVPRTKSSRWRRAPDRIGCGRIAFVAWTSDSAEARRAPLPWHRVRERRPRRDVQRNGPRWFFHTTLCRAPCRRGAVVFGEEAAAWATNHPRSVLRDLRGGYVNAPSLAACNSETELHRRIHGRWPGLGRSCPTRRTSLLHRRTPRGLRYAVALDVPSDVERYRARLPFVGVSSPRRYAVCRPRSRCRSAQRSGVASINHSATCHCCRGCRVRPLRGRDGRGSRSTCLVERSAAPAHQWLLHRSQTGWPVPTALVNASRG